MSWVFRLDFKKSQGWRREGSVVKSAVDLPTPILGGSPLLVIPALWLSSLSSGLRGLLHVCGRHTHTQYQSTNVK